MINLFGIVRQNKEEENNIIIEETPQDFQPREKRGILKELEYLNDQELIKRENNIIKEALEKGNNSEKNKNKSNINFRRGEDQLNLFLKERVTIQVLVKKDTKSLETDADAFKKAVKQPPIQPSDKISNWENDIIYDSDDDNAKEFVKSLRQDLPKNNAMEEEEEEEDDDDEGGDNGNDYNRFFYSQQQNHHPQQQLNNTNNNNVIVKINAKDVPCNPYLLNGMIIGDENTESFIDLISQNDVVPFKPLPLYLPKTDPSLIFSHKNRINKTTIIDDRFPRRMTYTQSMNRQNVTDIESVIHSTPTLQFIIPIEITTNYLKNKLSRQLEVTYAKEYINNNSFLTDAPLQCMSKLEDLSSLRNELILVEYSEPYQLVKNILGMRMNLVIWYRYPDEPSEDVKQQYYTRVLHDKERSPFLGDVEKNNPIMSLCSQLYYVPVVQKERSNNLFLLTLTPNPKGEMVGTIRKLPEIFVAGKIEPHKIIPVTKSKEYSSIENRYNYLEILKELYTGKYTGKRLMIDRLARMLSNDSKNSDLEKQIQDPNNPLHNLFRPITSNEYEIIEPLPSLEDCRSRITPEDLCVYLASKRYHDRIFEETKIDLKGNIDLTQYYNIYETVCKWESDISEKTKNLSEEQKKLFLEAFNNCSKDISEFKVGIEKLISIYSHSNALQSSVFIESHIQRKHIDKTMDLWRFPDEMFYDTIDYGYYKCFKNKDKIIQIKDTNYRSAKKSELIDKLYESNNRYDRIELQKLSKWDLVNMIKDERGEITETKVEREDEYNRRKQKLFNDYLEILKNPPDLNDDDDDDTNDNSQKAIMNILDLSSNNNDDDDTVIDDDNNNNNDMNDDNISISQHSVGAVSSSFTNEISQQEVLVEFQFKFVGDGLSEVEVKFNKNQKDIKRFKSKTNQSRKSRKPKKTTKLIMSKEKTKKNFSSNISYYSRNEKSEPKTRKELNEIFSDIISELKKSQRVLIAPFIRPVDTNLYPNYKTIIEHPKCIDDIDQSCVKCDYYNSDSFLSDVKLISSNAAKFNGDSAELAINSKKIVDYVETRVNEKIKEIKELENRIMELREKNPKRKGPMSERGERKRRKKQDTKQEVKNVNISLPEL